MSARLGNAPSDAQTPAIFNARRGGRRRFRVSCQSRRSVCEAASAGERVVAHMNRLFSGSRYYPSSCRALPRARTRRASFVAAFAPRFRVAARAITCDEITSRDNTIVKTSAVSKRTYFGRPRSSTIIRRMKHSRWRTTRTREFVH